MNTPVDPPTRPDTFTEYGLLIDGTWSESAGEEWIEVESPRDKTIIGRVARGREIDVERGVSAARGAYPAWRDRPARERGRLLLDIAGLLEPRAEEIARLIARENGNALRTQARGEVAFAIDAFRYFGGLASEAKGESLPLGPGLLDYSRREPFGVVGAVIPWNAPVQLGVLKIAPALAMGNTVVLKVSEEAPLAMMEVSRICAEILPPGVLNAIAGYGEEAGEALIGSSGIDKLSFTGSTPVGRRIMAAASKRIVPVSLELGGKNPQIVYPDANEDWVVDGTIAGMRFFRQGQSCTAGSRMYVHDSIFDSFLEKFTARLGSYVVGDPLDEATDIGAIVSAKQFERVCDFIGEGISIGGQASVSLGGLPPTSGPLSNGYYVQPTVFTGAEEHWRLMQEEIFGPVVCVIPWSDESAVIRLANETHYGLAAFVWTHDLGRAIRAAHSLDAGWVQVNQGGGQILGQSYGGFKSSGIGREVSLEGMLESYTHRKHVSVDITR